jgi:hypothetical protein
MKKFLAIYLGTPEAFKKWTALDEATRKQREQAGMEAWMRWGRDHQKSIVYDGGPLGKTKRADAGGVTDTKNALAGYVIVEAETHEAAARMFENHPHFAIFPGESVEIMECLPMPQM